MFEGISREFEAALATRDKQIHDLRRRCTVLEDRNIKEDRGDFLPASGHNQFDLDEIKRLKQKLKEATNENVNLSDELRHIQRRVFDHLNKSPNPSGDPNTGNI